MKIYPIFRVSTCSLFLAFACFGASPLTANEENLLGNGDFEEVDEVTPEAKESGIFGEWVLEGSPELMPRHWTLHEAHPGTISLIGDASRSGEYVCQVQQGWIYKSFPCSTGSRLKISFWGKGSGSVKVMLFQYEKGSDGSVAQFLPTAEIETIELSEEWNQYSLEYRIDHPEANDAAIAFAVAETMVIDDVSVASP